MTGYGLEELREAHGAGGAHTLRVCFPDHYGVLRGRRLATEQFLGEPTTPQAFCDGALVWDIRCGIFEEADFSNYRTGYPDLYAHPDLDTVRPCGWSEGEWLVMADSCDAHGVPIGVDSRRVLRRAVEKSGAAAPAEVTLELRVPDQAVVDSFSPGARPEFVGVLSDGLVACGIPLAAVTWDRPGRTLSLIINGADPVSVADAAVIARSAAREVSKRHDVDLTAMPRLGVADTPLSLRLWTEVTADDAFASRITDLDLMLRPLPIAHGSGLRLQAESTEAGCSVSASSDANPYLAMAALLIAGGSEARGSEGFESGYGSAIARFADASWSLEWLDELFRHDALALAVREKTMREEQVTSWDLTRYRECG